MSLCRAPLCTAPAHPFGPFCTRHWRQLPLHRQSAIFKARDAVKAARDPLVRECRAEPALEREVRAAAALLGPAPAPDHTEARTN